MENKASFPLMDSICPSQKVQFLGAKSPANRRISPTTPSFMRLSFKVFGNSHSAKNSVADSYCVPQIAAAVTNKNIEESCLFISF